MQIRFLGHAAVLLGAADKTTLLIDPYNPGGFGGRMGYAPIPYRADAVVCSHAHLDHAALKDLPNRPHVLDPEAPVARFGPFEVRRHRAHHDEYGGRRRGGSVDILEIRADGFSVVHLSDVGHSPTRALTRRLGRPDVLLVPTGGFYTIGAAQAHEWWRRLSPAVCVPIHYATARCTLALGPVADFARYFPPATIRQTPGSSIEVDSAMIKLGRSVVVLTPEC